MRFVSLFLSGALVALGGTTYWEPNRGQSGVSSGFLARTTSGIVGAGSNRISFMRRDGSVATLSLEGAASRPTASTGLALPGVSHYLRAGQPSIWDVPHYQSVQYRGVYRGIDLLYRSERSGNVEFDFLLSPGADPSRIRLIPSAGATIDPSGALRIGSTILRQPEAWQVVDGKRIPVAASFTLKNERIAFQLGPYDKTKSLTIDPIVQFATFLGGSNSDIGVRVAAGPDGAIYNAGNTASVDFPASLLPGDPLNRPDTILTRTAFISRLKSDATGLDWSLFIIGSGRQTALDMKLDALGNLFLLGDTNTPNFPVTAGAWRPTINPTGNDLFVAKFDAVTGHLKAATFLGVGALNDAGRLAVDAAGGVYVAGPGPYNGASFTPTPGAFSAAAPANSFAMRLSSALSSLIYATYWPYGSIASIDVTSNGSLLVGGTAGGCAQCRTPAFPAVNPLPGVDQNPLFPAQAYIAGLNPAGTAPIFASLLHGDGRDSGIGDIRLGPDGNIHVFGWTSGSAFPQVNPLTFDPIPNQSVPTPNDIVDAPFFARISPDGQNLLQSTLFLPFSLSEGQQLPTNLRLVFQANGPPCLSGLVIPVNYQTAGGLIAQSNAYSTFWSLSCLDPGSSTLSLRTLLPGTGGSGYTDLAATADGGFVFTGGATSLATTPGVLQPNFAGSGQYSVYTNSDLVPPGDSFLIKITLDNPAPVFQRASPDSILLDTAGTSACLTTITGTGFAWGMAVALNGQPVTSFQVNGSNSASVTFGCGLLQPGDNHLTATLPGPGGGVADQVLTGVNAAPITISVSPNSVAPGAPETKLVVRATNLTAASTLYWNGSPRTASYVADSSTVRTGHFELLIEPAEMAQPSVASITVSNPGPGGGTSPVATFTVQAAGTPAPPVLSVPYPISYGGYVGTVSQVNLAGSGLTANTTVFWDGNQVPVASAGATSVTFTPPAADVNHWGAHDVYVVANGLQSPTVRVLVGPSFINYAYASAYDPNQNRLYLLSQSATNGADPDLTIYNGTDGSVIQTIPAIAPQAAGMALSADGNYLYLWANAATGQGMIVRYNTSAAAVDLQWAVAPGSQTPIYISSIATPPDSPETLIVLTSDGRTQIFDRDQVRPFDSAAAGFSTNLSNSPIAFASASRIYWIQSGSNLGGSTGCWLWMDYDSYGISTFSNTCSPEPPETIHDHGAAYLTDGTRFRVVSMPGFQTLNSGYYNSPATAIAPASRRAWQLSVTNEFGPQLFEYNLDTLQVQEKVRTILNSSNTVTIYPAQNNAVLLVSGSFVLRVP